MLEQVQQFNKKNILKIKTLESSILACGLYLSGRKYIILRCTDRGLGGQGGARGGVWGWYCRRTPPSFKLILSGHCTTYKMSELMYCSNYRTFIAWSVLFWESNGAQWPYAQQNIKNENKHESCVSCNYVNGAWATGWGGCFCTNFFLFYFFYKNKKKEK